MLVKEGEHIKGLLFLKQMEADGNSTVVWEKKTLEMMNMMEEEKAKLK
jgi:hypothetical protein